ncbi:MAG: CDP-alcohol phosphatidyltransferase family protein [Phycisphaeraceae bacterium]|nr:CDP-alcohol phosphatidyltransferase family protein [Phycisphaeraceae bacterium]
MEPSLRPTVSGWLVQLPNALTVARVVIAAAFIAVASLAEFGEGGTPPRTHLWIALGLFIAGAITDALDGHLARRWRVVSQFGRVMDPFADKFLVLGACVMLAGPQFTTYALIDGANGGDHAWTRIQVSGFATWMAVVVLARELLITSLRGIIEGRGQSFAALPAGKIKMIVQSIGLPLILLTMAAAPDPTTGTARWAIVIAAWTTTLITAWSAVPYCFDGFRKLGAPMETA